MGAVHACCCGIAAQHTPCSLACLRCSELTTLRQLRLGALPELPRLMAPALDALPRLEALQLTLQEAVCPAGQGVCLPLALQQLSVRIDEPGQVGAAPP